MKKFLRNIIACFFLLPVFLVQAQTSATIFDENLVTTGGATALGSGWNSWSWGIATPTLTAVKTFKGVRAVDVTFTSAGGAFSPGTGIPFSTAGYKEINIAVYNVSNGDSLNFIAGAGGTTGATLYLPSYSATNTIPPNQWTWFRIPISHLNLGPNPSITWVAIQSSKTGQIYVDELRFDTDTTLYEGVEGQKGPGTQMYFWGSNNNAPLVVGSPDNYWVEFTAANAWGGVQVQEIFAGYTMPSASYTHLTVHFQKSNSSQAITAQLVDRLNNILGAVNLENYISPTPTTATPGVWYRAIVPLSAMLSGPVDLGGIVLVSSVPGMFKFDDIKLIDMTIPKIMRFPIQTTSYPLGAYSLDKITSVLDHQMSSVYSDKDGTILSFTGELFQFTAAYPKGGSAACYPKAGGGAWSSFLSGLYIGTMGCLDGQALNYEAHPGYDYVALTGVPVKAVASGVIVNQNNGCIPKGMLAGCIAWGAIGIDHGNGYVSQYLHLSSINVTPGQVIVEGQQIGLSGNTSPTPLGSHLHFEVLRKRDAYSNDYQPVSYATVDPYGFDFSKGYTDYITQFNNNIPNACLWKSGCKY